MEFFLIPKSPRDFRWLYVREEGESAFRTLGVWSPPEECTRDKYSCTPGWVKPMPRIKPFTFDAKDTREVERHQITRELAIGFLLQAIPEWNDWE